MQSATKTTVASQETNLSCEVKVETIVAFPIEMGMATFYTFTLLDKDHFAMRLGPVTGVPPLVRMHSECATGDIFFSL
jgi:GTP cyclohydrolase II